jgi:hypothetical protein
VTTHDPPVSEIELGGQRVAIGLLRVRVLRLLPPFESRSAMSDYLGVPSSRLDEWVKGDTLTASLLTDRSFVWERATDELADEAVRIWMSSPNPFIGEAPLEAMRRRTAGRGARSIGRLLRRQARLMLTPVLSREGHDCDAPRFAAWSPQHGQD